MTLTEDGMNATHDEGSYLRKPNGQQYASIRDIGDTETRTKEIWPQHLAKFSELETLLELSSSE